MCEADSTELNECGRALLEAGQFGAASEFLQADLAVDPASAAARLNFAIAVFHDKGAYSALCELGKIPPHGS
jgi:lipoprotein NlpI